jgi:sirohydrochlorin ferrochelatase
MRILPSGREKLLPPMVARANAAVGQGYAPAMLAGGTATVSRQTRDPGGERDPAEAAEGFRRLVKGWMAQDPAYDREAWPELGEDLDRNRPRSRKHFPEQARDRSKAAEG